MGTLPVLPNVFILARPTPEASIRAGPHLASAIAGMRGVNDKMETFYERRAASLAPA